MEIFQATPVNIEEGNHFSKQKLEEIITSTEIIHNFFRLRVIINPQSNINNILNILKNPCPLL